MRRLVLASLVVGSLAFPTAGAHAGDDSTYLGGCSFAAVTDVVAGQSQMTGEIDVEALVYSPAAASNPVWATFTCYIKVNGVAQPGAVVVASGTGVIVGGGVIAYTSASVSDHVQLCQSVDYTGPGDATPTSDTCFDTTTFEFPPDPTWCTDSCQPGICEVNVLLPDVPGVLDTNDQGDVYLAGEPFFDCPPYDMEWD